MKAEERRAYVTAQVLGTPTSWAWPYIVIQIHHGAITGNVQCADLDTAQHIKVMVESALIRIKR